MGSVEYFRDQKYERIKKQLIEQKSLFTDNLFPSTTASLGSADVLPEADDIQWKRPRDLCDNPRLFIDGKSIVQVKGGRLSSYWFLQALQIVAGIKELLFKVVVNYTDQEWQDGPDAYTGMFRFRFWRFGRWVEVVVDDLLPCADGQLLFSQSEDPSQFWQSLLEKAYAKLLGSYGALDEGHVADALVDFTGGVSEILDLKTGANDANEEYQANLYHTMIAEMTDHSVVCASIQASKEEHVEERTQEGLIRGRMYHVTALKKIHLTDIKLRNLFKRREKVEVIRLRDTRGSQGTSTMNSPTRSVDSTTEADSENTLTASQLTRLLSRNKAWSRLKDDDARNFGLSIDTEGEIWLPFDDFARYFHELILVRMYNYNLFVTGRRWHETCASSAWTQGERGTCLDRCGGGVISSETFFRNPQFILDINSEEEDIVIQFMHWIDSEANSSSSEAEDCKILPIGLTIFRVELNRKYRLKRDWGFTPQTLHLDHIRRRDLQYRGTLNKGRYLFVPTTFKAACLAQFLLRIISRSSLKLREIRQDIPSEICGLSCIASPALWVTVVAVKSATGLPVSKNVLCTVKCEKNKSKTGLCEEGKEVTWSDALVFYRRKPERPIIVKVYAHKPLTRNQFLGKVELQARVNHEPTTLEVCLSDKKGMPLPEQVLTIKVLTEDDLMFV